ncbi:prepilin-type N-terminal cleavage/methylation domain-containing protein [Aeoliella sp. ICT_H6.2]|uniref:Prepilin-type N-terminal cleavage/methylation domain-containing protein n=1 Tax=Aeoliella straminimaris TaxID=2954799 RepID=A0A9X2FEK5_9BACT|nr:prepilin-type N-terminal cleavage/methylation domain-containing protein [Aeoliella straminimaris]MCO6047595.1 prepilin-type N-terminal cleavage/methylation domain-containing protein [Aeoliella straminimaris]
MSPPRPVRSAFTLIEILLVLALLVVIAGFTVMTLDASVLRSKLHKGVDQVRTAWADGKHQSVASGQRMVFTCVLGGREFRLSPLGQIATPDPDAPVTENPQLPEGIVFRSLQAASPTALTQQTGSYYIDEGQWSQPVVFNPDGTSYDAVVVLEESSGKQMQVTLRGLTCTANASDVPSFRETR